MNLPLVFFLLDSVLVVAEILQQWRRLIDALLESSFGFLEANRTAEQLVVGNLVMVIFVLVIDFQDSLIGARLPVDQIISLSFLKIDILECILGFAEVLLTGQVLEAACAVHTLAW